MTFFAFISHQNATFTFSFPHLLFCIRAKDYLSVTSTEKGI